ncbi:MAG: hypothetical protein HY721_29195 [Planctomycetes bacterium]|nr:hypothetical protein [Planctomycetota bacterium]
MTVCFRRLALSPIAVGFLVAGALAPCVSFTQAQDNVLVKEGDLWRYFKGTEQPPIEWATVEFNDSDWEEGPSPFGYSSETKIPFKTTITDMQNNYLTLYTRRKFTLADRSAVKAFIIRAKYDDGFVAYVNGVEVLRKSMNVGDVNKDTPAIDHEEVNTFEASLLTCDVVENLKNGDNVLAVEGHNVNLTSSDFAISVELEIATNVCPTALTCTYRETTNQVTVRWTKPTGLGAFAYDALALTRNGRLIDPGPKGNQTSYIDRTPDPGLNEYRLVATACGVECPGDGAPTCTVQAGGPPEPSFRRGDADDNGAVNLTDAVFILGNLFRGGAAPSCPDTADADDNAVVNLTDAVYLLNHLFRGGPEPPLPGRETCGPDPTADELGACAYASACQ